VTAIAIGDTVFFESTRALGLGRAMTISMTYPLGAAALAAAFLGEPVTLPIAAGALLTLGGIVLIVAPWAERAPDERFAFGVGTATLASLAWAVSVVLVKAPLREMDAVTAQAIRLPLAALVLWATPWARALAQAERLRRHLEQLVLADPLEALLEVHGAGRGELGGVVRGGRAHVGELLLLGDVDVHVGVARVLADDLALVDLQTGAHEHHAARLEVVDRVGGGAAPAVGDEGAVRAVCDLALPVVPSVEQMIEESRAAGVGEKLRPVSDQSTRGDAVLEAHAPRAVGDHLHHRAPPRTDLLSDRADVLLGDVDHEVLHGLE